MNRGSCGPGTNGGGETGAAFKNGAGAGAGNACWEPEAAEKMLVAGASTAVLEPGGPATWLAGAGGCTGIVVVWDAVATKVVVVGAVVGGGIVVPPAERYTIATRAFAVEVKTGLTRQRIHIEFASKLADSLGQNVDAIIGASGLDRLLQTFVELRHSSARLLQMARLPGTHRISVTLRILNDGSLDAVVAQEKDGLLSSARQAQNGVGKFRQLMTGASLDLQRALIADTVHHFAHFGHISSFKLEDREGRLQEAGIVISDFGPHVQKRLKDSHFYQMMLRY